MKQPSPLVLILVLLAIALKVVERPLVRIVLLGATVVLVCVAVGRVLARRGILPFLGSRSNPAQRAAMRVALVRRCAWAIGPIAVAAVLAVFLIMLDTQPQLRATYVPEQFGNVQEIASNRGFYPVQVDAMDNRYVWTQERATLVIDFLVHRPITVTFMMRSAAVAGGPDAPVHVEANGVEVAQLHPDPANPNFQPLAIRFVPHDWGGQRTEVRLLATPFIPGKGDSRTLGTMVQSVSIDKSAAWSSIAQRIWLLWALPALALLVCALALAAHRYRAMAAGYGAVAASMVGAGCAAALGILILRIGFIARDTYLVWVAGSICASLCFAAAAVVLPLGQPGSRNLLQAIGVRFPHRPLTIARVRRRFHTLLPSIGEPSLAETRRSVLRDLLVVFLIAVGLRFVWVVVIPPWQAPDEPDHFSYVAHIVEQGEIFHPPFQDYPAYSKEAGTSWRLVFFGQISSLGAARPPELPYFPHAYDYGAVRAYQMPRADRFTSNAGRASPHPPLYYLLLAIPYGLLHNAPLLSRLFAVRCGSAILGALGCVFAYLIAYELRRERRWGWALGLSMALMPMYAFLTSTVNNDVGMDVAATALIWLTVRAYSRRTLARPLAFAIGLASGLTLLTKLTVYAIVLVAGAIVLVKAFPAMRAQWRHGRYVWDCLLTLGVYAAGVVIVYGPWALFRIRFYGDVGLPANPFPSLSRILSGVFRNAPPSSGPAAPPSAFSPSVLLSYLQHQQAGGLPYFQSLFINSFWGNFGWLDAPLPDRTFMFITIFSVVGVIGLLIQLALQPARRRGIFLLLVFLLAHAAFIFFVVDYSSFASSGSGFGLQGRYFFPILAPLLFFLLSGWDHLCRSHPLALRLAPAAMLTLNLIGLATLLARYYGVMIG